MSVAVVTGAASGIGLGVARQFVPTVTTSHSSIGTAVGPKRRHPTCRRRRPASCCRSRRRRPVVGRRGLRTGARRTRSSRHPRDERRRGIVRPPPRDHTGEVGQDHRGEPHRHVQLRPGRRARHARRRLGPHRHHFVIECAVRGAQYGPLRRLERRGDRSDKGVGSRPGAAVASPSTQSRPAWWILRWRGLRKRPAISPGSTWSARWCRSAERELRPTSPPRVPSSVARAAVTSPGRSSGSTAACTSEPAAGDVGGVGRYPVTGSDRKARSFVCRLVTNATPKR